MRALTSGCCESHCPDLSGFFALDARVYLMPSRLCGIRRGSREGHDADQRPVMRSTTVEVSMLPHSFRVVCQPAPWILSVLTTASSRDRASDQAIWRRGKGSGRAPWCASRSAAILYGKDHHFGLISAGRGGSLRPRAVYGALSWRAIRNARHVSNRAGKLHAKNRVPIRGVRMACNTPNSRLERARRLLHTLPDGQGQCGVQYATV
jgi:hypothetical protein